MFVKKNDTVLILSGKDKGKLGKILQAFPKSNKVIVEDVNKVKRHTKPSLNAPQGGIISKELPLNVSKVQLICPNCNKPTRVAHKLLDGNKNRLCKKCGEVIQ